MTITRTVEMRTVKGIHFCRNNFQEQVEYTTYATDTLGISNAVVYGMDIVTDDYIFEDTETLEVNLFEYLKFKLLGRF